MEGVRDYAKVLYAGFCLSMSPRELIVTSPKESEVQSAVDELSTETLMLVVQ